MDRHDRFLRIYLLFPGILLAYTVLFWAPMAFAMIPAFSGRALTGTSISEKNLRGKQAVLIVAHSREVSKQTQKWENALRAQLTGDIAVRNILAPDALFFASEVAALEWMRKQTPTRYWYETWLVTHGDLKKDLQVPPGERVSVYVIDATGDIVARVGGSLTDEKMEKVKNTLNASTAARPQ